MNKVGRPVGIQEKLPHRLKPSNGSVNKDGDAYLYSDSGCKEVTTMIGQPSLCLHCPLEKCLLDEIKKSGWQGSKK